MHTMKKITTLFALFIAFMANAQTPFMKDVQGINVGDTIVNFNAIDKDSKRYHLKNDLVHGDVVVIFIRGEWCGYCNRHMNNLQDSLSQITAKKATVVIVSPEKPKYLEMTTQKANLKATILYDSGYVIMKQFDVLWAPDKAMEAKFKKYFGDDLKESHSDDSQRLPVPATYIIGQDGVIKWRHFDRNYRKRSTVKDILENL
ncbi:MAG: alkyl hydroperoxide reductase [Bacteroidetes bacterium]|nr:MAG: alkyl hydroperoxide reductase [Bacteroidota bacterium]